MTTSGNQCSIHGCEEPAEYDMLSYNGWPVEACRWDAADWNRRGLAKLRTEVTA